MKARILILVAALALGGCGTDVGKTQENATVTAAVQAGDKHNDTDVMYLQMMVAHHEQGLEMVRIAEGRTTTPELADLVKAVDLTQADEVTMMKGWLDSWSEPATVDHAPSAHADHGGLPATGPEEMKALREAKGSEFETTFINLFVAHQHNAVEMAGMERTGGANDETKAFAERVRQSRTDQIRQLLTMLNG